jgi:holo-[acyl-carrier protein] synthase
MSVIGIGVDVIECSRIQHSIERFGDRFLHRVFTDGEIEYSMSMKFPERHLAARFAGKEAVSKAFGTGIGKAMGWRNIDIQKKKSGEPFLVFSGPAEAFAAERGVTSALIIRNIRRSLASFSKASLRYQCCSCSHAPAVRHFIRYWLQFEQRPATGRWLHYRLTSSRPHEQN